MITLTHPFTQQPYMAGKLTSRQQAHLGYFQTMPPKFQCNHP